MQRKNYRSGAKWEDLVGYSRAVRVGNLVEVSGTVAVDGNSRLVGAENAYEQTKFILKKIETVLQQADCGMKDVIRTRIFVTDISLWEDVARAHSEYFDEIRPVTTLVEISRLMNASYLVEIEATAYIP